MIKNTFVVKCEGGTTTTLSSAARGEKGALSTTSATARGRDTSTFETLRWKSLKVPLAVRGDAPGGRVYSALDLRLPQVVVGVTV